MDKSTTVAGYGVGFTLYGIADLALRELLGLSSIESLQSHWLAISIGFILLGVGLMYIAIRSL